MVLAAVLGVIALAAVAVVLWPAGKTEQAIDRAKWVNDLFALAAAADAAGEPGLAVAARALIAALVAKKTVLP